MLKLISTPGLSPSAFEVNNSFVLPFKRSRLEHVPGSQRLCQHVQRLFAFCAKEMCPAPSQGGDFSRMRFQPWVPVGQARWMSGVECTCFQSEFSISFTEQQRYCSVNTSRFTLFTTKHIFSPFSFFTLRVFMYVLKILFGSSFPGLI